MAAKNSGIDSEIAVQDMVANDYENIRYSKEYSAKYQSLWFCEMLSLIASRGLILDNGCGVGYLSTFLPSDDVVGIDISMGMLLRAKSKMSRLVRGDAQNLPFEDETFDSIFCRSLLHHLPNPSQGINELHRVLKMNGELVVSEPIKSVLSGIPRKLVRHKHRFSSLHKDFKQGDLIDMLKDKFTIEVVKNFGYIAYPILGFPDLVDPLDHLPFGKGIASVLIQLDKVLSHIPWLRTQSFGITVKASKSK